MKKRTYLKRMLAMGLALAMSLSLAACGNNEDNTESTPESEQRGIPRA